MQLTVRDVSSLLKVSEKTVYRWIKQGILPAYRVNEQYRFNRAELLEWATSRKINVSAEIFEEPESHADAAARASPRRCRPAASSTASAARTRSRCCARWSSTCACRRRSTASSCCACCWRARALRSTGIGDGIAIPHVRNPIVLHVPRPMITLCFLEKPVDFGALDGKPVHALFSLISPTVRAHLHLLSRLVVRAARRRLQETPSPARRRATRSSPRRGASRRRSISAQRRDGKHGE